MAAHLRVVDTASGPGAKKPRSRKSASKKPADETTRERRNRLARERRARKREADAATQAAATEAKAEKELTLLDAIELGDQLQILKVQRREAARALPTLTGQSLPAMHRQIAQLTEKISALEASQTEGTDIGDAIETPDEDFDPDA